ncbi:MAG: hypothetical protein KHX53_07100 [Bacteroides sp.]|nr:hypothetical protein [Bacteroides sp.]
MSVQFVIGIMALSFKASTSGKVPQYSHRSTGVLPPKYWSTAKEVLKAC